MAYQAHESAALPGAQLPCAAGLALPLLDDCACSRWLGNCCGYLHVTLMHALKHRAGMQGHKNLTTGILLDTDMNMGVTCTMLTGQRPDQPVPGSNMPMLCFM